MKKIFTLISVALLCLSASAQVNLANAIEDALKASNDEYCSVFLDHTKEYVLDSNVDLGLQKAVIWGAGAKVTVKGEGQLSTQTYLQVRNVNFLCAEATKAIIGLSTTPDPSLKINEESSAIKFEGANQKVYWIDNQVSVILCNFVDLGQSLIYANKQPYALANLKIDQCVVQLRGSKIDPVINWVGSNSGAIKNIVLSNNLIYNVSQDNTSSFMIKYGLGSNAQPQKIWGTDGFSRFQMYNNTISFPGNRFADQFPSKNNIYLNWKRNIFINTPKLNRTSQSAVHEFTKADNLLYATEGFTIDNTDKEKYGTVEEIGVSVPTESLDIDNIAAVKDYFYPQAVKPYINFYGFSRWVTSSIKYGIAKTPGLSYEAAITYDMVIKKMKSGSQKNGIDIANYPWVAYSYPGSILDDGTCEVAAGNAYTSIDRVTGEDVEENNRQMLPTTSGEWIAGYPKVEMGYYTDAAGNKIDCAKTLKFYVADIVKARVLLTGGGSSLNTAKVVVKDVLTGEVVKEFESGDMTGKSNKKNNCQSKLITIDELDAANAYEIEVIPVAGSTLVVAIHLFSTDDSVFPVCHAPKTKAPGTNYEVVLGPDMLTTKTKGGVDKPAINDAEYNWITYVNPTSTLDDGSAEVQTSNRKTDINPTTGVKGELLQVIGKNGSVNSPVVSPTWGKNITFGVTGTTLFTVYAAGSASGSAADGNAIKVTVTSNTGEVKEYNSTPGGIYGKGTASDFLSVKLDPAKAYAVNVDALVAKDIMITGINLTGTDLSIAPVEEEPGMGDATGIENVETAPVQNGRIYNVLGQEVKSAKGLVIKNGKKYIVR